MGIGTVRVGTRWRAVAGLGLTATLIVATYSWIESIGGPARIRERFGATGLAVSFLAHYVLNLTPLGEIVPMALANGAIWGFQLGALVSWAGWMGASLTQYLVVRALGTAWDVDERLRRLPAGFRDAPVDRALFQVGGRSLPWVGLHLVNVTAAVRGVPLPRFLLFAALGQAVPALVDVVLV